MLFRYHMVQRKFLLIVENNKKRREDNLGIIIFIFSRSSKFEEKFELVIVQIVLWSFQYQNQKITKSSIL